ncbi:MAG: glutathione S-transferase family protein [Sphingomonadaceae bacterium]
MAEMTLFLFPGACSRVALTALEHVGADYDAVMIDLFKGEHMAPAYRAVNPRGKVPALLVDGELLSENGAIQLWLHETYPQAGLLPAAANAWERAQQHSDLFWLSSVWHPYVRANKMPMRWTTGDIAPVRERGKELLAPCVEQLEERLADRDWWYGDWSILDVYFYWAYTTAEEGEFDLAPFPRIARHRSAIEALPAFRRALEREAQAKAERTEPA